MSRAIIVLNRDAEAIKNRPIVKGKQRKISRSLIFLKRSTRFWKKSLIPKGNTLALDSVEGRERYALPPNLSFEEVSSARFLSALRFFKCRLIDSPLTQTSDHTSCFLP